MRSETLQRFLAVYLLELRLTCLHWSYLIFIALWSIFIVVQYTQNDFSSIFGLQNIVLALSSLIAMFLTGLQASRAQRSRVDMLEVALPTGVEMFLARWLASLTAVAALLVAPLIVLLLVPAGRVTLFDALRMVGLTLLASAFATGLIWVVQNTVGIRRWMYPFFPVLWVGAGMIPGALRINGDLQIPGTQLLDFITMEQNIESMWGALPKGQLPTLFLIFYVGLVALFAGIMLWRTISARFYRRSPLVMALTVVALGVVLVAGTSYTAEVHARNQQLVAELDYAGANLMNVELAEHMPFTVTAYDVTFANESPARFTANIDVTNRSDAAISELMFSLYRQFEVTDASTPFTRDRNLLTLTLPEPLAAGESTSVSVTYQGSLWYMGHRYDKAAEVDYFVHPEGVNLGCEVLWYPVPGWLLPNHTSYYVNGESRQNCLLDIPATFRLTVSDAGDLSYASNLTQVNATTFESAGTTWAQLIGVAGLQTVTEGALTVVAMADDMETVLPQVQRYYLPAMQNLQRFFPEMQHLTVTVLNLEGQSFGSWDSQPSTAESLVITVEPNNFQWFETNQQSQYDRVGANMVRSIFGARNYMLEENIAYFLWLHYVANGDTAEMRTLLDNGLPVGNEGTRSFYSQSYEERYPITFALYDVYVAQGEAAIDALVREMYAQRETLSAMTTADQVAWIRAQ